MTVQRFSADFLAGLSGDALRSPRGRSHSNVHTSYQDPCQRFFNAIGMTSYIRPHRHALDPKPETLIAVKGLFALLIFEQGGEIREIVCFGTERYGDGRIDVGAEIPSDTWHTVIALEAHGVLFELKAGPFEPGSAKEPAPWAPEEGTAAAQPYLDELRARARGSLSRYSCSRVDRPLVAGSIQQDL